MQSGGFFYMRVFLLLSVIAGICGCVTPIDVGHREVPGPGGEKLYEARCNGAGASFGDCMTEAANSCEGGQYEIVSKDGQSATAGTGGLYYSQQVAVMTRQIVYRCPKGFLPIPPEPERTLPNGQPAH
jgi:hypothetical protein